MQGKKYSSPEELTLRRSIYEANSATIRAHNALSLPWQMGTNSFSDLSPAEFRAALPALLQPSSSAAAAAASSPPLFTAPSSAPPAEWDWSTKGAVTPVKNQGGCGSCWAFSATGSIEGAVFLHTGRLHSLSEQQIVDCDSKNGCGGGSMQSAFEYVIRAKGQCNESAYPYRARDGKCVDHCARVGVISGFRGVASRSEADLVAAIAGRPVSVAIEADQASFQHYSRGVLTAACGSKLDHGVLAVGYGSQAGEDFYKIKNSWGAGWGDKGYVLLGRGAKYGGDGQCGVQVDASFATA
jgi:C1A family cysteine protease